MDINNCTQIGHERIQVTHLCKFEDCKLQPQCCIQCINEGIHNHGKSDIEHIRLIQQEQQILPQLKNDQDIKPIDFSQRKYTVKQIDNSSQYYRAHISSNEKYLVYADIDELLRIYDIKENIIIKEIKFNYKSIRF